MKRLKNYATWFVGLSFLICTWCAKGWAIGYCDGHAKKIIDGEDWFEAVQQELNRYSSQANLFNQRYELCFQITSRDVSLPLGLDKKLVVNNVSNREVVIGFLKARRTDDSTTPILEIRGRNVTVFAPEIGNVKQAFKLFGAGHKIVDGIINGMANAPDSPCISGNTSKSEIKNLTLNNCTNAISLSGSGNSVENVTILPHATDYERRQDPQTQQRESDEEYNSRLLASRPTWPSGICLFMGGQSGLIKSVYLDKCYGVGIQVLGSGFRIESSQIQGESEFEGDKTRYSADCLFIKKSSNIVAESNEISNCREGLHIQDSQQVFIGPEQLADFESRHNKLHHNDYAIHAQNSQQVFAWHNSVYENGAILPDEEAYHFGFWLDSANYLDAILLKEPILILGAKDLDEDQNPVTIPIINYQSEKPFVEVSVPVTEGVIELSLPLISSNADTLYWYQPHAPLMDCPFEDVPIGLDGYGKVKCFVEQNSIDKSINQKVVAIVHAPVAGSSPLSETVGIFNTKPGIPVAIPASESGNMNAEAGASGSAGSSGGLSAGGEVVAVLTGGGGGGGGVSGGGGGASPKAGCQLNPATKKNQPEFFASVIILFVVIGLLRRRYGVG